MGRKEIGDFKQQTSEISNEKIWIWLRKENKKPNLFL